MKSNIVQNNNKKITNITYEHGEGIIQGEEMKEANMKFYKTITVLTLL